MSTVPPSRTASVAEPRRTSASLRQKTRPTSASIGQENRPDSKASATRKGSTTTTTETRTERRVVEERLLMRTRSPLKPTEGSNGRKSSNATEKPQMAEKVRTEGGAAQQCE